MFQPLTVWTIFRQMKAFIKICRVDSNLLLTEQSRLVSSLSYGTRAIPVLILLAFEYKKYMETVSMTKSRPRKNKSERSDFPQDYHAI